MAPSTKATAYSWIKSPRYSGKPYEAGPLARMWVNGDYRTGISVMGTFIDEAPPADSRLGALKKLARAKTPVDQARTIIQHNARLVGRSLAGARPGDLLYFHQDSGAAPDHLPGRQRLPA